MIRRKKIRQPRIKIGNQVPAGTKLPGLVNLFKSAGLVDEHGKPTEEGRKALAEGDLSNPT